jgi:type IV pilus assembly protein PilV
MLLEVLIALLIFALGILGLVGLQASAIQQSGQAKLRADATLLADELIGQMWVTNKAFATLSAGFSSDGAGGPLYVAWKTRVNATLPGSATYPPLVSITQVPPLDAIVAGASSPAVGLTPSSRVTITMRWKSPTEPPADPPRNFVLVAQIR